MGQDKKEVCTIRIAFPVNSDDEAIDYKKKISEVLKDNPDVQIQFGIMSNPTRAPLG